MKISNCCGENGNVKFYETEWLYSEAGMCPKCGEHCEFIEVNKGYDSEWFEPAFKTQKTALMELIEWNNKELLEAKHVIDNAKYYDERIVSMADKYYRAHYQVNKKATELLPKERKQIEEAFLDAINMGDDISPSTARSLFEDYYNKTYKQ